MSLDNTAVVPLTGGAYTLDQSLRFNSSDSPYLSRNTSTENTNKKGTFSFWVKKADTSNNQYIYQSRESGNNNNRFEIVLTTTERVRVNGFSGGGSQICSVALSGVLRDVGAWYHIVVAIDTTQSTASNRVRIYINGEEQTDYSATSYYGQNDTPSFNWSDPTQYIGSNVGSDNLDSYLSEFYFIDNQQLDASNFGETGDYGEWKPKEYTGTYGTNGFYLPFKNDYEVEGFSTVTWTGTSASNGDGITQYIGGVGFQPDLVWIKGRNQARDHVVHDTVRGLTQGLHTNRTDAEYNNENVVEATHTDGFTAGDFNNSNYTGWTYVGWTWDMGSGSYGLPYTITREGSQIISHSTAQSKVGSSSIDCTSSGYLEIADDPSLDFPSDLTIEFWMRPTGTDGSWQGILSKRQGDNDHWYIEIPSSGTGTIKFHHVSTAEGGWDGRLDLISTTSVALNTWYHVAVVREGYNWRLYVDGTLEAETNDDRSWGNNSGILTIAKSSNSDDNRFNGYLDEIRLSNKARYNADFTPSTTAFSNDDNTVLLIHSDTTNGSTTFTDSSGADENTDGSITSYVKANTTYGQSIVSYTGTGSSGTVGHGLSSAPDMVIVRPRTSSTHWRVWHTGLSGGNYFLELDLTNAEANNEPIFSSAPTSSVINPSSDYYSSNDFIAYCFHSVSGYSKFGSYTGNGSTSGPSVTLGFKPAFLLIKNSSSTYSWNIIDTTRGEDKLVWANSSGAEESLNYIDITDTGFDIVSAHPNINGNTYTYIYMAFADNREFAYWLDQSGNNNDWTSNNLTESDISVDSPTNNFATLNPLDYYHSPTWSEGNLKWSGSSFSVGKSTMGRKTGKFYFEILQVSTINPSNPIIYGMCELENGTNGNTHTAQDQGFFLYVDNGTAHNTYVVVNGSATQNSSYFSSLNAGDVVQFAYDADTGKAWAGINGTWLNSGDPAAGTGYIHQFSGDYTMGPCMDHAGVAYTAILNAGQDSSFAGNKTAQGNTDSNEIGDFYYTPPSGYLALCTANLPDPAANPSKFFKAITYTGAGNGTAITGVGFQPDLGWFANRNNDNKPIYDVQRGTNRIYSNLSGAESSGSFVSFDSDGFTVNADGEIGDSGGSYVAWLWKAGGTAVSNTDGTITSTVSANQDAGFSIVKYTGTNVDLEEIGHGLNGAPDWYMVKDLDGGRSWRVGAAPHIDRAYSFYLDNTSGVSSQDSWGNKTPTSTVVKLGQDAGTNTSGNEYIMYCFKSTEGVSKAGVYVGNGSADGAFVYTGFRPAFVFLVVYDEVSGKLVFDNAINPYNVMDTRLRADNTGGDDTSSGNYVDFLSNGIKFRSNDSGNTVKNWLYLAFAEQPFKYTNAR